MRVLLVHDYARQYAGAEVMLDAYAGELARRGHTVARFTSSAGLHDASPPLAQAPEFTCHGTLGRTRGALQAANPWAPSRLRRAIRTFAPDVVHVKMFLTQLSPTILPVLRHATAIHHAVWYRSVCPTGSRLLPDGRACEAPVGTACLTSGCVSMLDWLPRMTQFALLRRWREVFRRVIANSAHTRAVLERFDMPVDDVVHNGIDDETSADREATLAARPTIVYVGRLTREKGVDVLLDAVARLDARGTSVRLEIVGDGPSRDTLERACDDLGLRASVRFHGHVARARVAAIAGSAWALAVPSRWAEPFGVVAIESMLRGTPVIATTGGGLEEIVTDQITGWLVPPGDAVALADALFEAAADADRCRRMGRAAFADARARFSLRAHTDAMLAQYELARHATRTPRAASERTGSVA